MAPEKKPTPADLWHQAHMENPGSQWGTGQRYLDLMQQHGYVVPREEGDDSPLFECGYDPRDSRGTTDG